MRQLTVLDFRSINFPSIDTLVNLPFVTGVSKAIVLGSVSGSVSTSASMAASDELELESLKGSSPFNARLSIERRKKIVKTGSKKIRHVQKLAISK